MLAVAAYTDTAVLDLDPLYHAVDPDHVDGVFDGDGTRGENATVSFDFSGCRVTIGGGEIQVTVSTGSSQE